MVFKELIYYNGIFRVGLCPNNKKEDLDTHKDPRVMWAQRKDQVRKRQKDGHLDTRREASRGPNLPKS
jgi:hypothetical protein